MASIRRTLSPLYQDRSHESGGGHKGFSNGGSSNKHSSSQFLSYLTKFLGVTSDPKSSRRGPWKRPLYMFLVFFLLGFLLGLTPYGKMEDINGSDRLSFEIRKPYVEERLGNNQKREDIAVDAVSFVAETEIEKKEINLVEKKEINLVPQKLIIVVTPTYNRAMQAYYLNRVAQTLRLAESPVLWIVVEAKVASLETSEILRKTGVMYRHLVCKKNMTSIKDRGVHQRNTALEHIELHKLDGIVYFADDDNIYSLELFQSIRKIRRFGTWPVAMLAPSKNKAILEGPVCNGSQVIGWHTNEKSKRLRRFHVDMSGFAFNSTILWDPKRWPRPFTHPIRQLDSVKEGFQETTFIEQLVADDFQVDSVKEGFQETTFIEQLVADESEMEGVPPGCSKILNWHLHLDARNIPYPQGWTIEKNLQALS